MTLNAEMESEDKHQLSAKIDNVKNVLHMLRVVNFKEVRPEPRSLHSRL